MSEMPSILQRFTESKRDGDGERDRAKGRKEYKNENVTYNKKLFDFTKSDKAMRGNGIPTRCISAYIEKASVFFLWCQPFDSLAREYQDRYRYRK